MCGQAGIHRRTDKAIPKLDKLSNELLLAIESRGRDATGFLTLMDNGKVQLAKQTVTASRFVAKRGRMHRNARTVLLHTRFATVGDKGDPRNAHPVASGKVAAVHNGTIRNADEVFQTFNLPRVGTVDSEVIPALIDREGWDNVATCLELLQGGAATAIVHTDHPNEVILARLRMYPMVYGVTRDVVIWASTAEAIERAWWRTYGKRFSGKLVSLAEGSYVHINGKVIPGTLKVAEPPRIVTTYQAYRPSTTHPLRPSYPKMSKSQRKRARRNGARPIQGQTTIERVVDEELERKRSCWEEALAAESPYFNYPRETDEEWDYTDEEAITSLMRQGCSRAVAESIIYDEDDEDDIWCTASPATRALYALD